MSVCLSYCRTGRALLQLVVAGCDLAVRPVIRRVPRGPILANAMKLLALALCVLVLACGASPAAESTAGPSTLQIVRVASGIMPGSALAFVGNDLLIGETIPGTRPSDTRSRVRRMRGVDQVLETFISDESGELRGLASGEGGPVFIARRSSPDLSKSAIAMYGVDGKPLSKVAPGQVSDPSGLAIGPAGEIYVADTSAARVLRINKAGEVIRVAGTGKCDRSPLAAPSGGRAVDVSLCFPELLALDPFGNLYVARRGSSWIARVDASGQLVVVTESIDVAGLAIDNSGALLASDSKAGTIRRFEIGAATRIIASHIAAPAAIVVGPGGVIIVESDADGTLLKLTTSR